MKPIRSLLVLFPLLASLALAADNLPIFRGLISAGSASKFALADPVSGNTSWVSVGGKFGDWTVADFDAKAASLSLKNGTKKPTISLANSSAASAQPATGSDEKSTLAQANDVLKKMNFDQMLAKTLEQQKKSSMDMVDQMMGQLVPAGSMSPDDLAAVSQMQKQMMDLITSAMNPADMHNDIAQAYADTFSPEELDGLGAFYSTPAGQALSDKTPALQAKIQAAMTPRIMAVMPQVQQAAATFAQQQAAKKATAAAPAAGK